MVWGPPVAIWLLSRKFQVFSLPCSLILLIGPGAIAPLYWSPSEGGVLSGHPHLKDDIHTTTGKSNFADIRGEKFGLCLKKRSSKSSLIFLITKRREDGGSTVGAKL